MSKNIDQVYTANPITSNAGTDLMYFGQSPYGVGDDAGMLYSDFVKPIQQSAFNIGTDTGVADAYSVTLSPTVTSYTNGLWVLFNPVNANATGTPTLSVNGLAALQISNTYGGQLYPFDLNPGFIAVCFYCAIENSFILVNPISSGVQLGNIQNNNYTGVSDSGTVNAYVMTLAPAPASIPGAGVNYTLQYAANANTGASTLTINGTVFDIVTPNYSPLVGGEILVNGSYDFLTSYNGVASVAILLNSSLSAGGGGADAYAQNAALLSAAIPTGYTLNPSPVTTLTAIDFSMLITSTSNFNGQYENTTSIDFSNFSTCGAGFILVANSLTSLSLPALTSVTGAFQINSTSATSANFSLLATVGGTLQLALNNITTSIALPALTSASSAVGVTGESAASISLPLLATIGGDLQLNGDALTSVDLSSVQTIAGDLRGSSATLDTYNLPAIVSIGGKIFWDYTFGITKMPALVNFSLGAGLLLVGSDVIIQHSSLSLASVDGLLASLAALDGTGGTTSYDGHTIDISGGTSAAPDAAGLASIAILTGRGNTVNHN